jgi:hypothetical protein
MGFSCVCCMCIFIIILYESVHLQSILYVLILYKVQKFLCGIAQLDVGDATIWYQSSSFQH